MIELTICSIRKYKITTKMFVFVGEQLFHLLLFLSSFFPFSSYVCVWVSTFLSRVCVCVCVRACVRPAVVFQFHRYNVKPVSLCG